MSRSFFFTEIRLKTNDFRVYQIIEISIMDFRMTFMQIQKRTGKYTNWFLTAHKYIETKVKFANLFWQFYLAFWLPCDSSSWPFFQQPLDSIFLKNDNFEFVLSYWDMIEFRMTFMQIRKRKYTNWFLKARK